MRLSAAESAAETVTLNHARVYQSPLRSNLVNTEVQKVGSYGRVVFNLVFRIKVVYRGPSKVSDVYQLALIIKDYITCGSSKKLSNESNSDTR